MAGSARASRKADDRKYELRLFVENTKAALSKCGYDFEVISYPVSYRERSIDVIAVKGDNRLLIRIKLGSKNLQREEVSDLTKAASAMDAVPIVLSNDVMYEDVVVEKEGVYMMSSKTFSKVLREFEEVFIIERRGELYVRIDAKKLDTYRLAKRLSIGDLALRSGVSRRMVFEYLKGNSNVSLKVAERLIEALNEDIIESINVKTLRSMLIKAPPDDDADIRRILKDLEAAPMHVYRINKSAPDYILRHGEGPEVKFVVNGSHVNRVPFKSIVKKIIESDKLAKVVSSEVIAVLGSSLRDAVLSELATYNLNMSRIAVVEHK